MEKYKWDKRRAKQTARTKTSQFDIFDLGLLILVFAYGTVIFKFLGIYVFTVQAGNCIEQVANFGAATGDVPIFKQLFYLSIILLLYWLSLVFFRPKKRKTWVTTLWHSFMFICIWALGMSSYHMSIWDYPNPPDGILMVDEGMWARDNGQLIWKQIPPRLWVGHGDNSPVLNYRQHRVQECVWLEDGLVSVNKNLFITDDYDAYAQNILDGSYLYNNYIITTPKHHMLKDALKLLVTKKSLSETFRDSQLTRPLGPMERRRFQKKQTCIAEAYMANSPLRGRPHKEIVIFCDPPNVPPYVDEYYPLLSKEY